MFDAFDNVFSGSGVTASIRRKCPDGVTRAVKLATAPAGFGLDAFADAAMHGATASKRGDERGVSKNVTKQVTGAAGRSVVLGLADPVATVATVATADATENAHATAAQETGRARSGRRS